MLARTADSLYWVSRYVERAEYLARILEATTRLSNLPSSYGGAASEWESAVKTAGCGDLFARHHDKADEASVHHFLCFSSENPSSIRNCLEIARANARAVRTALTYEMWDTLNSAWLELRKYDGRKLSRDDYGRFIEFVKALSLTFDGSAYRTMLRSDAYWFSRLGVYVERADNTARILDVKYHVLLPATEQVGGSLDYFQWTTILREVSALTAYHWVYRESIKPWLVADLLIFNRQMPRSFASCYENISRFLDAIGETYGRQGPSQRMARKTLSMLSHRKMGDIYDNGLHEFITEFIDDNNRLGSIISEQYLV
ncbi:MAG: alpha-E domain-containing protein [Bosea sp.]|jgi:uncharacterized alpha-E superfamily protein|nr:alpha-E domain-containing protein [Bosea sp. (in: a-proteobacteria)]